MGCDGGSIVSRRDIIVKTKKQSTTTTTTTNNNNADDQSNMEQLWNTCAYSGEPLKEPIVCCRAGQLYNKESILELLIQKKMNQSLKSSTLTHVTRLKHIFPIHFTYQSTTTTTTTTTTPTNTKDSTNNNNKNDQQQQQQQQQQKIKICAVTRKEMTSSGKFYAIVKCGHVFHESVFQPSQQQQPSSIKKKNTKDNDSSSSDDYCMTCSQVFDREQDLIWLNPPFHMIQQAIQKYSTVTNDKHKNVNKNDKHKNKKRTESSHNNNNNNNNKKRRHEYDDAVEPSSLKKSKFLDILHT